MKNTNKKKRNITQKNKKAMQSYCHIQLCLFRIPTISYFHFLIIMENVRKVFYIFTERDMMKIFHKRIRIKNS